MTTITANSDPTMMACPTIQPLACACAPAPYVIEIVDAIF